MDFEAMFSAIEAACARTRAEYHISLGQLIEALEQMDPDANIGIGDPHSYRGYYVDIAFAPGDYTVRETLASAREAVGRTFHGYKGDKYLMDEHTPVWIAEYSRTGEALILIRNGELITKERNTP